MNNWWKSSSLFIHFHPFIDSVTHSLTNPLLSLCLTVSRILETQPVRERQSCRDKGSPEWSVLPGECRGDPHPQASLVELLRLLGEGQAPEEMGRSHAARPHLLVCGMWGPCSVLSPTPPRSASVTSLRTGMKHQAHCCFTKRYNRGLPPVVWPAPAPSPVPGPQAMPPDKMNQEGVQGGQGAG